MSNSLEALGARNNAIEINQQKFAMPHIYNTEQTNIIEASGDPSLSYRFYNYLSQENGNIASKVLLGGAVILGLAYAGVKGYTNGPNEIDVASSAEASPSPAASPSPEACENNWQIVEAEANDENRWDEDENDPISKAIRESRTEEEAKTAIKSWFGERKADPEQAAAVVNKALKQDLTAEDFRGEDGCISETGAKWLNEVEVAFDSEDASFLSGIVPEHYNNTGMSADGRIVTSEGVGGSKESRRGILVVMPNGERFWVLARCEQIATREKPKFPEGQTDNPQNPEDKPRRPKKPQPSPSSTPPTQERHKAGTPPSGVRQSPRSQPVTPGYVAGNGESVVAQQDSEKPSGLEPTKKGTQAGGPGTSPGGGEQSVIRKPANDAPKNPVYIQGSESGGTSAGTSNDAGSEAANTEGTGQTSGAGSDPGGF